MNTSPAIKSKTETSREKEQFWKGHARCQRESGLSRIAYCRKHQLNHNQFNYWHRKWRQEVVSQRLLPIHLNEIPTIAQPAQAEALCTLAFKNGHVLKIHDESVLPLLLSLWG